MILYLSRVFLTVILTAISLSAQIATGTVPFITVPHGIEFSNIATDQSGNPVTGVTRITFSMYENARGGEALWSETQNVSLDSSGQYSVYLGLTQPKGIPMGLFAGGQARWLGVSVAGQPEQARAFLVSVPYAMKSGNADTLGGLPLSAFVLAGNAKTITPSSPETFAEETILEPTSKNQEHTPLSSDPTVYVSCNSGTEIGALINAAGGTLAATGGVISISPGTCTLSVPVVFNTLYKPILLECAPGYATTINTNITSGAVITLNWGWNSNPATTGAGAGAGVTGCTLVNSGGGMPVAIEIAGSNGGAGQDAIIANNAIVGFGAGIDNAAGGISGFKTAIFNNRIINNNIGINLSTQAENMAIENNLISNNAIGLFIGSATDAQVLKNSFDSNTTYGVQTNGAGVYFFGNHFENSNMANNINFQYMYVTNSHVIMVGDSMAEDRPACTGAGNCTSLITVTATGCCTYFEANGTYLSSMVPYTEFANLANANVTALFNVENPSGKFPLLYNPTTPALVNLMGFSGYQQAGTPFGSLPQSAVVGMSQFCTNCVPTTPASCSTNSPASCICKAGTGSMTARFENFMNNGNNWYCH